MENKISSRLKGNNIYGKIGKGIWNLGEACKGKLGSQRQPHWESDLKQDSEKRERGKKRERKKKPEQ